MTFDDTPRDQRTLNQIKADADEIAADALQSEVLLEALENPQNPFAIFVAKMREVAVEATISLMTADLYSQKGIEEARACQRELGLFRDMISVIQRILESGRLAEEEFNASDESAQAHIKAAVEGLLVRHRRPAGQPDA